LSLLALLLMVGAVLWVYHPPQLFQHDAVLRGGDFTSLHWRRIEFAQIALRGPDHRLPAWYPREMLGTPFWSNLQNFPMIPTRLVLLLASEAWYAYAPAVNLAAVLSAVFTYVLCRRLGLGRVGAATAGWTFACAGFFASRVFSGHLPLLEAYPALPLLLWLAERYSGAASPRSVRLSLVALALATGCVVLAGHPQLPAYAIGATLVYVMARRMGRRRTALAIGAMFAGILCAGFALVPMARLIGRSTRVLNLARADNDFAFPAWRLHGLLFPWSDGWPTGVTPAGSAQTPFTRGPDALFLDTVSYVGWLPVVAAIALLSVSVARRRTPDRRWLVLAAIGLAALLMALPWARSLVTGGPWTLLRSPARQLYVTTFALALAAGAGVHHLAAASVKSGSPRWRGLLVAAVLVAALGLHAFDLRRHAAAYVHVVVARAPDDPPDVVPAERVAIDAVINHPWNRRFDDVGVFDSILLARPYRALLALSNWPVDVNRQLLDGSELSGRALAWSGAALALTTRTDPVGLEPAEPMPPPLILYRVPAPLPRAGFVPADGVRHLADDAVYDAMRGGAKSDPHVIFLPSGSTAPSAANATAASPPGASSVNYARPSSDEIHVHVRAAGPGYVRVLESWDPGWSGAVDGRPVDVALADGFVMAVPVAPGTHEVRLTYATPGVATGAVVSTLGLLLLTGVVLAARRVEVEARATGAARAGGNVDG
jgi:hypothetical protein